MSLCRCFRLTLFEGTGTRKLTKIKFGKIARSQRKKSVKNVGKRPGTANFYTRSDSRMSGLSGGLTGVDLGREP